MKENNQHINQLLTRCKKSDKHAQMQIYKDYYRAMYNTALRILKDEFEAEDIMQEAFLTAFTKLDSFKGEVTFGAAFPDVFSRPSFLDVFILLKIKMYILAKKNCHQ